MKSSQWSQIFQHHHFASITSTLPTWTTRVRLVSPSISPFPSFWIHFIRSTQRYSNALCKNPFPNLRSKTKKILFTTLAPQAPTEGLSGIISEPPKMHSVEPTWRTKPTSQAKSAWDELWVVWLLRKAGLALTSLTCFFVGLKDPK